MYCEPPPHNQQQAEPTFSGTVETREMARPIVSARPTRPTLRAEGGEGAEWVYKGGACVCACVL